MELVSQMPTSGLGKNTVRFDMNIRIKKINTNAVIPTRATPGSAGFDLSAYLGGITIYPGESATIATGLSIAIEPGFVGMVCSRSGLARNYRIAVLNAPGIIDESYRGELGVILINHGREPFYVGHGDRIAQLVIVPYLMVDFVEVEELDSTERGTGGFGSTGK